MDRITKALLKARSEQGVTQMPGRQRNALVPTEIDYTQTKTVEIYPGWLKQNHIITTSVADELAIPYKVLRTQVAQRMRREGWQTLAVTSPGRREGKTTTAMNLGISLALDSKQTVLLMDADLKKPDIHSYFGFEVDCGLKDYLEGDYEIADILVHPKIRRLVVIPGHGSMSGSSEMLSSPRMLSLLQELKSRYSSRYIIIDLPPTLTSDDTLVIAPYVDAVLVVAEEGKTLREDLARTHAILDKSDVNIIGTVLNKTAQEI